MVLVSLLPPRFDRASFGGGVTAQLAAGKDAACHGDHDDEAEHDEDEDEAAFHAG